MITRRFFLQISSTATCSILLLTRFKSVNASSTPHSNYGECGLPAGLPFSLATSPNLYTGTPFVPNPRQTSNGGYVVQAQPNRRKFLKFWER